MTAATSDILVHLENQVLTLTLNRAAKKNAFTQDMYRQMHEQLTQAAGNDAVRVVVIQGNVATFSAGNDLGDFLKSTEQEGGVSEHSPVFQFLRSLVVFPKPLVAAVCGPAVGVGTTMLLHCDLVVAGDNAVFSLPFVNLGLCPEAGSSLLLPALAGSHRAAEALMLGEPFFVEAAMDMGLVNRILPPTEVNDAAQALAARLAAKPAAALRETKRLLRAHTQADTLQRIDDEAKSFINLLGQPAAKEAVSAFLEKRKPDFSGL